MQDDRCVETAASSLAVGVAEVVHDREIVSVGFGQGRGLPRPGFLRGWFPGSASEPQQVARQVEGVRDLLEERQLLHPALATHVVVEAPLGDVRGGSDPARAHTPRVEQAEQRAHVTVRAGGEEALVIEQPGDDIAYVR